MPGDIVEVSEHLFNRGVACGHLKPVPKPEPKIVEEIASTELPPPTKSDETPSSPEHKEPPKKKEDKK